MHTFDIQDFDEQQWMIALCSRLHESGRNATLGKMAAILFCWPEIVFCSSLPPGDSRWQLIVSSDAGWASSDVLGPARPAQAAPNSCSGPQSLDWRPGTGSQRRGETPEIVSSEQWGCELQNKSCCRYRWAQCCDASVCSLSWAGRECWMLVYTTLITESDSLICCPLLSMHFLDNIRGVSAGNLIP